MKMRLFKIEAVASGTWCERDVRCPLEWIGSGVYDVDHECWQKVSLEVAAESMEKALEFAVGYSSMDYNFSVDDICFLSALDMGPFDCDEPGIFDFGEGELVEGVWQG